MLRLLTITTRFPTAAAPACGATVAAQLAALAQPPQRMQVQVIAPVAMPPPRRPLLSLFFGLGVSEPAPPLRRESLLALSALRPAFALAAGVGWRDQLRLQREASTRAADALAAEGFVPDAVYAPALFPCGVAAAAVARRLGVPLSLRGAGPDLELAERLPETRAALLDAVAQAAAILCSSDSLRRALAQLGVPPPKLGLLLPGVDLDHFRGHDQAALKEELGLIGPVIAAPGPLVPAERHAMLVEAVAAVPDVILVLAGEGPEAERLRDMAHRLGIGARLRLLPPAARHEPAKLFGAADILASAAAAASIDERWLQGMACGTPLALLASGPAREVVTGPHAGRLVREASSEGFAEAIRILLAYPPRRDMVRAAAERFSSDKTVAGLKAHLSALVGA